MSIVSKLNNTCFQRNNMKTSRITYITLCKSSTTLLYHSQHYLDQSQHYVDHLQCYKDRQLGEAWDFIFTNSMSF